MDVHEEKLDALLDADRPEPSDDFDRRFWARMRDEAEALDGLLDADRPEPTDGFDERFDARLAAERRADRLAGSGRPGRSARRDRPGPRRARRSRWGAAAAALVAVAAGVLLVVLPLDRATEPPDDDLLFVAHLDLLEVYDEVEVFDALVDPETFEMIAALDTLEGKEVMQ